MASYAITNDKGRLNLDLEKNKTYTVQVSYIGMKTLSEEIVTKEDNLY